MQSILDGIDARIIEKKGLHSRVHNTHTHTQTTILIIIKIEEEKIGRCERDRQPEIEKGQKENIM